MMRLKNILFVVLALLLVGQSCRKDRFEKVDDPDQPPVVRNIESTVKGIVKDEDGNAIEGAVVTLGSNQTETDQQGIFTITGLANERNGFLKVEKPGFFDAFPAFSPFKEGFSRVDVKLISDQVTRLVSGEIGGKVDLIDGASVSFESGSFELNGSIYQGDVTIRTAYLDPTRDDLSEVMPGNLYALNSEGEERVLQSFGMLQIEIQDDAGNELSLVKDAEIKVPVPFALRNDAPVTIPLWFFDEVKGCWIEEGEAVLNGDSYIGEVSHFTWWNCDAQEELVTLTGRVTIDGIGSRKRIIIQNRSTGVSRLAFSNSQGYFTGLVPKEVPLTFKLADFCKEYFSHDLGALNESLEVAFDFNSENINESSSLFRVIGNVTDCNGNGDPLAYLQLEINESMAFLNSHVLFVDEDGVFDERIELPCSGDIENMWVRYRAGRVGQRLLNCNHQLPLETEEPNMINLSTCFFDQKYKGVLERPGLPPVEYVAVYSRQIDLNTFNDAGIVLQPQSDELRFHFRLINIDGPGQVTYTPVVDISAKWRMLNDGNVTIHEYNGLCKRLIVEIEGFTLVDERDGTRTPNCRIYFESYFNNSFDR